MPARSIRPWWHFILRVVKDKVTMEKKLLPSDLYWLMRARLADVDGIDVDAQEDSGFPLFPL